MSTRLLLVGDVHLGRPPARLPSSVADHGVSPAGLGPTAGWRTAVQAAIDHQVAALVLAGDVVDSTNARFEAFGLLQEGVQKLADAGIQVCAVAGNHDVEVLPRLAGAIVGFHLLGAGGTWTDHVIESAEGPPVRLLGWSFPAPYVHQSPLANLPPQAVEGPPTLGILHGDLDGGSGSRYAPVRRSELAGRGPLAWFLGHVHNPSLQPDSDEPGYLGSLVPLDPSETGPHGPWLVTVGPGGRLTREHLLLSPLRFEPLEIAADGLTEPAEELLGLVSEAMRARQGGLGDELAATQALGFQLRFSGSVGLPRQLAGALASGRLAESPWRESGRVLFISSWADATRPALDLAELARGSDPPGLLARSLRSLERDDELAAQLIAAATPRIADAAAHAHFNGLPPTEISTGMVRGLLLRSGYRALEELLAQQEEGR
jgi:exonuclease SbcD